MGDRFIPSEKNAYNLLRLGLGITYFWFGALKVFGISPVGPLIRASYSFIPYEPFGIILGIFEVVIGLGFLIGKKMSWVVTLMLLQMVGVILSVPLAPDRFFQKGNVLALTLEGEFMIKNLVLITSALMLLVLSRKQSSD